MLDAFFTEKGAIFDSYMTNKNRTEIQPKDLDDREKEQMVVGMKKEWKKLTDTKAIKIHTGAEAQRLRETVDPMNILESRLYIRAENLQRIRKKPRLNPDGV